MRAPPHLPPPLWLRLAGGPLAARLAGARQEVTTWAAGVGLSGDLVDDLVLAAHEALANVADHAYPGGVGEAWLHLTRTRHTVEVDVRDHGRWRPPPVEPGRRGHGLKIIRALADSVEVRHDGTGTLVRMCWWLT